ncbi:MAG: transketolase C-terminal domain-containing protein [Chloroflexota bacterium]|nr:hypothetical protein [Chloroflexota bacterium]
MSRMRRDNAKDAVANQIKKVARNPIAKFGYRSKLVTGSGEKMTVREALLGTLTNNEKLVVLASALATHALPDPANKLAELACEVASNYPARFFGLGELLEDLVPTVHQLIAQGLKPLVLMGSTDLARSYAGLSALCSARSSVVFLMASGPEEKGTCSGQSINDLAILRTLLPLSIGVPSSPAELKRQLAVALQSEEGPIALHYSAIIPEMPLAKPTLAPLPGIGKAQMLHEGKGMAIVALGAAVGPALALADELERLGHQAAVIDTSWLRPLDEPLLTAIANYFSRLITLETGKLTAGFGAALLEMLETNNLHMVQVKRISLEEYLTLDPTVMLERLLTDVNGFLEKAWQEEGLVSSSLFHLHPSEAT